MKNHPQRQRIAREEQRASQTGGSMNDPLTTEVDDWTNITERLARVEQALLEAQAAMEGAVARITGQTLRAGRYLSAAQSHCPSGQTDYNCESGWQKQEAYQ